MTGRPFGSRLRTAVVLAAVLATSGATLAAVPELAPPTVASVEAIGAGQDGPGHDHAGHDHAAHDHGSRCPADRLLPAGAPGGPRPCSHDDAPPPGVDVTEPVATAALEARAGATASAAEAAEDAGVPTAAQLAATTDRVRCDGDGSTGYRVQAVYAVAQGTASRYTQVVDEIRQWSAGVDAVFNRSAAKTRGVRDVRWVTSTNADGTCSPAVLSVTLPATALTRDFGATVAALHARGFTDPTRKYLVWADATALCGIAETYLSSRPGQDNPNNGFYPQIGRVDSGCWGHAASVEAHELSHLLGSVQADAPNATQYGHCTDESDRLCYADGGPEVMRTVCARDHEVLLDCRDDDYYSTAPPAGSYLATHWNTASSRFLVTGGSGAPTALGGMLSVNDPAVAGLPTELEMGVELPAGRTSRTTWSTSRPDCTFSAPRSEQTTITCDTGVTTDAPVTAVTVDSTGERIERRADVTFARGTRWARARMGIDTTRGSTYAACPRGRAVLTATVVDKATLLPVKGATVRWLRTVGTAAPVQVAAARTAVDGTATTAAAVTMAAGTLRAVTDPSPTFPAVASGPVTVTVASSACATTLTARADTTEVVAGAPVTLTGVLTRVGAGGVTVPVAGETLAVRHRAPGASTTTKIGATRPTRADGSFSVVVRPTTSGTVQVVLPARAGYLASASSPAELVVRPWSTTLRATSSHVELDAGTPVRVSGTLLQTEGATTAPSAGRPVSVSYPVAPGRTASVTATTDATGAFLATVRPLVSGPVTARFAGSPGWAASDADPMPVAVREQATAVTVGASSTDTMAGVPVVLSGTVTQTGYDGTRPFAGATVVLTFPAPGGGATTVTALTDAAGRYARTVRPLVSGPVTARFAATPGWAGSVAPSVGLTVRTWGTGVTVRSSATTVVRGGPVTVSGTLSARDSAGVWRPLASAPLTVGYPASTTGTASMSTRTSSTGTWSVTVRPGASGVVTATFAATPYREGARAAVTVSVR